MLGLIREIIGFHIHDTLSWVALFLFIHSFDFYCLWEELSNTNFKLAESREFKIDSATQSFTMSPSRWIKETNAIGFVSKRGKYDGGTFAHPDIAFEFASWLSPEFK